MKLTFYDLEQSDVTILNHAGDLFSALVSISNIARRQARKDELSRTEVLNAILEEIPTIIDEVE